MSPLRTRTLLATLIVAALLLLQLVPVGAAGPAAVTPTGLEDLLLAEIVVTPTGGEFVEIYNAGGVAIDLSSVYLTDATFAGGSTYYYNIVTGTNAGGGGFADFHARFPNGATIGPGEYQTIALAGSSAFVAEYGVSPTYELFEDGAAADAVPDMQEALPGSINNQGGLSNDGEVVILYHWDGESDLVYDLDYAVWGDKVEAVDKTGVSIDGPDPNADPSAYLPDTAIADQDLLDTGGHDFGNSWQRDNFVEGNEVQSGGNGIAGSDETSEDLSSTWCEAEPTPGMASACPIQVNINEIRIDQSGSDVDEYFELLGTPGKPLAGLTYLVIGDSSEGLSGVVEAVVDLSGQSLSVEGLLLAAEDTFTLGTADLTANLNFENSDNVTHLVVSDFTGADGDDLDTDDDGTLDVTPWSEVIDCVALVETPGSGEQIYCATTVGPDGDFVPGHVFYCDDGWRIGDFSPVGSDDTPGAANACEVVIGSCGDPATLIHDVQGSGLASALDGMNVEVEGVVVGDFQAGDQLGGFFLQEEDGDADVDAMTSEGVFVYDGGFGVDVAVGDMVRVKGIVDEFFGLTEITAVDSVQVCDPGAGGATAATITLPVASLDDWEPTEGMLVTFPQTLVASDNFNLGRYGELTLSLENRLDNPTDVVEPGAPANALQELNDRSSIQLDDGSTVQNPLPLPPYIGADNTLRAGDTVVGLTGVLGYGFGFYEVHPTGQVSFTRVNERPAVAPDVGGTIVAASFNVLNYFSTIDTGDPICGPNEDQDCRGADSPEEFANQRAKILSALVLMDADIVGLIEIENSPGAAVQDLVDGLNDLMGAGTYDFIDTGTIGSDAIKVAFIYKPATVSLVGSYAILDSSVDARFNDDKNRPALAQTFEEVATGGRFTAVINHLKSKGSDCEDVGDPDVGDGQGNCNLTRSAAAAAMVDWLATDPTGSGDDDFLIMGDLNAYAMEDPIDIVKAGSDDTAGTSDDYLDLVEAYEGPGAYTYVFFGQLGSLDHALGNASLASQVTGAAVWHINADEPSALDYNNYNQPDLYNPDPYRSSDHDPVLVGMTLEPTPIAVTVDIKPGGESNPINLTSQGVIPVAILSTADFDAATVDPSTLRFGPAGAMPVHNRLHLEDVNGDGLLDLVAHFRTQETGIQCGDDSAALEGQTLSGRPIYGQDSIVTVNCGTIATKRPL